MNDASKESYISSVEEKKGWINSREEDGTIDEVYIYLPP